LDRAAVSQEVEEVLARYPLLRAERDGSNIRILGTFTISDCGEEIDRFHIEMVLTEDYPKSLPKVWEVAGRIPRTADRHVYPRTGQACTMLPEQRWELWPSGSTLLMYVEGPMRNYFIGQAHVENGLPWPWGEWPHDFEGVLEYYKGLLKTQTFAQASSLLHAAGLPHLQGYNDCPCGSKKRTWHCHGDVLKNLRARMGPENAVQAHRDFVAAFQLELMYARQEQTVPARKARAEKQTAPT
jgi:hypothetical protein